MSEFLFDPGERRQPSPGEVAGGALEAAAGGKPRLRIPHRDQVEMRWASLDQLLEPDHQARMVWAAADRVRRIEEALKHCAELQYQREESAKKSGRKVTEARASTTDPEARTMQFSDGGYRPGYNVQFSTDTGSGVIVGMDVVSAGNDSEQLPPMLDQIQERHQRTPDEALVDGGFASKDAIEEATGKHGCTVYAPLKDEEKQRAAGKDPHARKKGDSKAVAAWRARMRTVAAKAIYRLRCQTAEWVNAVCRNRGFWRMPVRGLPQCRTVGVLYAITHNPLTAFRLRAEAQMSG